MKPLRRKFLHLAAGAAALPVAQAYPTRPVRWIVGFSPGGSADIHSRLIAQWLSERLGQFIENRRGAGANIALQAATNSQPDGYTLVTISSSNASSATLYESLPFNLQRDLIPLGRRESHFAPPVCLKHPGFDVDVIVAADIMTFYQVWFGRLSLLDAVRKKLVRLDGAPADIHAFPSWFAWSPMAETVRATLAHRRIASPPATATNSPRMKSSLTRIAS
jgi:hypothetical protein